jgi:acyl dehydratase
MFPLTLATRRFDETDQFSFARLSGDFNPIHMDQLTARRTNASATVVHGMHAVLWAIDKLVEMHLVNDQIVSLRVQFTKFIFVGNTVELKLLEMSHTSLRAALVFDDLVAVTLILGIGTRRVAREDAIEGELDTVVIERPADFPRLEDLEERSGWIDNFAPPQQIERQFRYATAELGARVTTVALLSTLVGMVCPGLHSLFAAFSIELVEGSPNKPGIGFRVMETDERFRMVRIKVFGCGVLGSVQAFLRWPPVPQASVDDIAKLVAPTEFAGRTALIIGGSRGLGALTAKIVAAGGGKVIATYATGRDDASTLAQEINTQLASDTCKIMRYDVRENASDQLASLISDISHMYYFATPQIARQKSRFFVESLLNEFIQVYVNAFYDCCRFFDERGRSLTAYYPSSVFVESRPTGMAEYSMAKMAGEILCSYTNRANGHIHVITDRLPRLSTDQTATLPPLKSADPLEIMLPIIRRVQSVPPPP